MASPKKTYHKRQSKASKIMADLLLSSKADIWLDIWTNWSIYFAGCIVEFWPWLGLSHNDYYPAVSFIERKHEIRQIALKGVFIN